MIKNPDKENNHHHKKWSLEEMVMKFNNPERDEWQKPDKIIALFGEPKNRIILDLGAGTGYFTFKLAEKGFSVISMDTEQSRLDYIAETSISLHLEDKIKTRLTPETHPELKKDEVDGILIIDTYHHFNNRINYLEKFHESLKKKGKLIILEHFPDKNTDIGPPADFRMPPGTIVAEIKNAGFTGCKVEEELLPRHYIVISEK
ncbi:MAG: methyltransferase domain-containing protein [Spirochaetales bacterium]|nr:methyltransferase domain-containing protein [Spirochaetales bacterium]